MWRSQIRQLEGEFFVISLRLRYLLLPLVLSFSCSLTFVTLTAAPSFANETEDQASVEAFYKGRTINIVIGSMAGGGYDFYGRLVGRAIGKYIPGKPGVTPTNMPGAGGNTAAAYVYSVAPRDGSTIAASSSGALLDKLIGDPSLVRYDPLLFNLIGSANSEVAVCVVRKSAQVKSFQDVFEKEIIIGTSGGTTRDLPMALKNILGAKLKLVTGYAGSREVMLAMEKNEVEGLCGIGYQATISQRPHWFTQESPMHALVQETLKGHPELDRAGSPLALNFAKTPEDRKALEIIYAQLTFTRPFMMAPDVPRERVSAIRRAFILALNDNDLNAEAKKLNLAVDPMSGEELESKVKELYAQPSELINRVRAAIAAQ